MSLYTSHQWRPDFTNIIFNWYKADSLNLTDGANVVSWNDSSPMGWAQDSTTLLTNSTQSQQPIFKTNILNGHPGILFNGSQALQSSPGLSTSLANTYFAVFQATALPTSGTSALISSIYSLSNNSTTSLWMNNGVSGKGAFSFAVRNSGLVGYPGVSLTLDTGPHILMRQWNGAGFLTAVSYKFQMDNISYTPVDDTGLTSSTQRTTMGGDIFGGVVNSGFQGYIFESMLFQQQQGTFMDQYLSSAIYNYLKLKYLP